MSDNAEKKQSFLQRKNVVFSLKRYGIDALGAMALGLFVSLIAGLIIKTIGQKFGVLLHIDYVNLKGETVPGIKFLVDAGVFAMAMMGPAIGVAIAWGLQAPPLVLFSCAVCGSAGAALGGPAGAFFASVIGAEFGKIVSKETKVDIIVTPIVTILTGVAVAVVFGPPIDMVMKGFGALVNNATTLQPLPMGILVSVIMGIILTLPISSAAIAVSIGLTGLAAGAATAGCCAQMVGFAVISYKVNGMGGLVSQGIGTSMLQVPNIVKKPAIWIPVILTSAITGPIATVIFKMTNNPSGAGMGTAGFVGQFGTFADMGANGESGTSILVKILIVQFILPIVLSLLFANIMFKKGIIKPEDMKLEI